MEHNKNNVLFLFPRQRVFYCIFSAQSARPDALPAAMSWKYLRGRTTMATDCMSLISLAAWNR
jgi:hypothetical protein